MRNQIPHPLHGTPLNSVTGGFSVFLRESAAKFANLENAERDRSLIVGILVKKLKALPIASDRLFDLIAIVQNMLDSLQVRRQHRYSPSLESHFPGIASHWACGLPAPAC